MSRPSDRPVFTLHLCSFAQDVQGLLTMVNAGIGSIAPGQSLHLAGFVVGSKEDLTKEPLLISMSSGEDSPRELVRVPAPPTDLFPDTDEVLRTALTFDLSHWSLGATPGAYEVVTRFAGAEHRMPVNVAAAPAHAE